MPQYFQFKVTLQDIDPPIWRRFLLREDATFLDLHQAIQAAFDWFGGHLWEFSSSGRSGEPIAGPDDDGGDFGPPLGEPAPNAARVRLADYLGRNRRGRRASCLYTYDFGDGWEHDVRLERVITRDETFGRRLLEGERAAPPEDCGGVFGYERLAALARTGTLAGEEPDEEELEELREWIEDWHPDTFDLEAQRAVFDR